VFGKMPRLILRRLANRLLIEVTDWTFLHNETSIDLAWDIWDPETKWKLWRNAFVSNKHNLPWMSSTIKAKMKKRNSVYRRARKMGNPSLWNKYDSLRNQVAKILRQS